MWYVGHDALWNLPKILNQTDWLIVKTFLAQEGGAGDLSSNSSLLNKVILNPNEQVMFFSFHMWTCAPNEFPEKNLNISRSEEKQGEKSRSGL